MLTVLYQEACKGTIQGMSAEYQDLVAVELRRWDHQGACDVILDTRVCQDGEWTHKGLRALDGLTHTNAELIRAAIAEFDQFLAAHPNLPVQNP